MLHPGVRLAILRMRASAPGSFRISIQRGSLIITTAFLITHPEQLEDFTRWGLTIRDQALLARAEGITFVDEAPETETREIICQVCGEEIRQDKVQCRRCETPHHRDCWYYFGACSTYGCRETRFFETAKVTQLTAPPVVRTTRRTHPR